MSGCAYYGLSHYLACIVDAVTDGVSGSWICQRQEFSALCSKSIKGKVVVRIIAHHQLMVVDAVQFCGCGARIKDVLIRAALIKIPLPVTRILNHKANDLVRFVNACRECIVIGGLAWRFNKRKLAVTPGKALLLLRISRLAYNLTGVINTPSLSNQLSSVL